MLRWMLVVCLLLNGLFCSVGLAADAADDLAGAYRGKKILWIDSYHEGYAWTDGVGRGIEQGLAGSGVELKVWHMDTNRNRSEAYGRQAGRLAKVQIEEFGPDLVIASDDNAQKYLVEPFLKDTDLSVVFCGVNHDPAEYGYPCRNVTGMREVDLAESLVRLMRAFAAGERIGMIADDTESARIVNEYYHQIFGHRLKTYMVRTVAEFQEAFLLAQREVDMLCLHNASIQDWEDRVAESFLVEQTRIPTGSVNSWMRKFVIFSLVILPEEQGAYAAATSLRILAGTRPEGIPVVQNQEAQLTVNLKMAQAAGIVLPVSLLQTAEVIGQEALQK